MQMYRQRFVFDTHFFILIDLPIRDDPENVSPSPFPFTIAKHGFVI